MKKELFVLVLVVFVSVFVFVVDFGVDLIDFYFFGKNLELIV